MYRIQTLDSYDLSDQHADKGKKYSAGGGVGVLPYMGHIGICCCNEYSFQAVYM